MTFAASDKKKEDIIDKVIQRRKRLRFLSTCGRLAIAACVIIAIVYVGMHFLLPDLGTVVVAGVPKKDILSIASRTILILIFGIITHYCIGLLLVNRTSKDLTERTDEVLEIADGAILYTFRSRYHASQDNRIFVSIPFQNVKSFSFEKETCKLKIYGKLSSLVIDHYDPAKTYHAASGNLSELVIYDYFSPSLFESLQEYGLTIQEE